MMGTLMQVCDPNKGFVDYLVGLNIPKAITCQFAPTIGILVFGMLVFSGVGLPIYIRTGRVEIPAILLLLTGGAILPYVAAPVFPIVTVLLLVTGAGVMTYLYYRYSR